MLLCFNIIIARIVIYKEELGFFLQWTRESASHLGHPCGECHRYTSSDSSGFPISEDLSTTDVLLKLLSLFLHVPFILRLMESQHRDFFKLLFDSEHLIVFLLFLLSFLTYKQVRVGFAIHQWSERWQRWIVFVNDISKGIGFSTLWRSKERRIV